MTAEAKGPTIPWYISGVEFVYEDNKDRAAWMDDPKFKRVRFIKLSKLFSMLDMEPWPMQKIDISALI